MVLVFPDSYWALHGGMSVEKSLDTLAAHSDEVDISHTHSLRGHNIHTISDGECHIDKPRPRTRILDDKLR